MSSITDELRNENYEIIKILANSKRFTMRTLQGRKTLFDNKDRLLNHIKKEDETIHETLKNATKGILRIQVYIENDSCKLVVPVTGI